MRKKKRISKEDIDKLFKDRVYNKLDDKVLYELSDFLVDIDDLLNEVDAKELGSTDFAKEQLKEVSRGKVNEKEYKINYDYEIDDAESILNDLSKKEIIEDDVTEVLDLKKDFIEFNRDITMEESGDIDQDCNSEDVQRVVSQRDLDNLSRDDEIVVDTQEYSEGKEVEMENVFDLEDIIINPIESKYKEGQDLKDVRNYDREDSEVGLQNSIATNIKERLEDVSSNVNRVKELIENAEQSSKEDLRDYLSELRDRLKSDLTEEVSNLRIDLNEAISEIEVCSQSEKGRKDICEYNLELVEKLESINAEIKYIKAAISPENREYLEDFKNSILDLKSVLTSDIETSIEQFKLNLKSFRELLTDKGLDDCESDNKINVVKSINALKVDLQLLKQMLDNPYNIERLNDNILDLKQLIEFGVVGNFDDLKINLEQVKQILERDDISDFMAIKSDIMENIDLVKSEVSDVKQVIENPDFSHFDNITEQIEDLKNIVQSENSQKTFENIQIGITNAIEETFQDVPLAKKSDVKSSTNYIVTEIDDLREKLIEMLATFFQNMSFENETQQIQDTIDINFHNVQKEIANVQRDVQSAKNDLSDGLSINFIPVVDKLNSLQALNSVVGSVYEILTKTSDETSQYSYTLLDTEADISKLRLILKDFQDCVSKKGEKTQEEIKNIIDRLVVIADDIKRVNNNTIEQDVGLLQNQVDSIHDDIVSISERTNRLIIASDNVVKTYTENIEEVKSILSQVCNFSDQSIILSNKLDNLKEYTEINNNSIDNLNKAFSFLAPWIDNTSKLLNRIVEDISPSNQNERLENFKVEILEKYNEMFSIMREDFAVLKSKNSEDIDNIERKIKNNLENLEQVQNRINESIGQKFDKLDVKLNELCKKSEASEDLTKNYKKLAERIDDLETMMYRFDKNISKIVNHFVKDEQKSE